MIPVVFGCALAGSAWCGATLAEGERLALTFDLAAHVAGGPSGSFDLARHLAVDLRVTEIDDARARLRVKVREAGEQTPGEPLTTAPWQGRRFDVVWDGQALTVDAPRLSAAERASFTSTLQLVLVSAGIGLPPAVRAWAPPEPGATLSIDDAPWLGDLFAADEVEAGEFRYAGVEGGLDTFDLHLRMSEIERGAQTRIALDGPVRVDPTDGRVVSSSFTGTLQIEPVTDADGTVPAGRSRGMGPMTWTLAVERR